jgi:hypothetical protein
LETTSRGDKIVSNLRNAQLLQQVGGHPLKASLAKALDIAEAFAGDVEFLSLNKDLSDQGRANAMQSKLRAAVRDLRDARAPIVDLQTKLDAKRKLVSMPKFDRSDDYGLKLRMELRQTLKTTTDPGQRALLLAKPAYADALLETEPEVSGLFLAEDFKGTISPEIQRDRDTVAAAKEQRLAGLFGPELAEIEALEEVVKQANMIADIARGDLKLHSGIDDQRVFEEFVRPVEAKQNAPWLRRFVEDGREVIRVVDLENHAARVATEREILDGKYYRDHQEFLADRSAA